MNTNAAKELNAYPKYKAAYIRAFDRMLAERIKRGKDINNWRTGEDVMKWWTARRRKNVVDENQYMFELENTTTEDN